MNSNKITYVSGRICSGKGYVCNSLLKPGTDHIVVSDIVRSIVKSSDRTVLQHTANLDTLISKKLVELVTQSFEKGHNVLIDGVRQPSVLVGVQGMDAYHTYIWVQAADDVRKQRYIQRTDVKDSDTPFELAEINDNLLGLDELEKWFKNDLKAVTWHND